MLKSKGYLQGHPQNGNNNALLVQICKNSFKTNKF